MSSEIPVVILTQVEGGHSELVEGSHPELVEGGHPELVEGLDVGTSTSSA